MKTLSIWFRTSAAEAGTVQLGEGNHAVTLDVPAVRAGGVITREMSGHRKQGLPRRAPAVDDLLDECERLLTGHYAEAAGDAIDATLGWDDEASRMRFLDLVAALEGRLDRSLGPRWAVHIDPSPGLIEVRLMGEYGSHWPLWIPGGATEAGDWPSLSEQLATRLISWGRVAAPDHDGCPDPEETEVLRRDLAAELGPHFAVIATD